LFIWDVRDWREVHRLELGSDTVRSAAFLPDSRRVVSAHASGKLIVWDLVHTYPPFYRVFQRNVLS
jgi:WD40 repeat protein